MQRLDRRALLSAGGAALLAALTPRATEALQRTEAVFGTAYLTDQGAYGAAILAEDGSVVTRVALPARGHDVVFSPAAPNRAVVFARRPGTFAVAFATDGSIEPTLFSTPPDRHFYGHGAFSPDGKLLFATENDYDDGRGVIGLYDATDGFRRVGEFPSHGTGPHDLLIMPDGKRLAIANGGLETHPDYGRAKLNVATMQPSLAIIDARDGALLERHALAAELSKVSLRHMARDDSGGLFVAGQFEGNPALRVPLIARWSETAGLSALPLPEAATARLNGYIGSIAVNRASGRLAVSSPKGGVALHFPIDDPSRVTVVEQREVCGLAASGDGFAATAMDGTMRLPARATRTNPLRWDNHLSRTPAGPRS